jgi:hypothetical protein
MGTYNILIIYQPQKSENNLAVIQELIHIKSDTNWSVLNLVMKLTEHNTSSHRSKHFTAIEWEILKHEIPHRGSSSSSLVPSTKPSCGGWHPNPLGGTTHQRCKSTPPSSPCLPLPTKWGMTNCCSRLGAPPWDGVVVRAGRGSIHNGIPLPVLEQHPGFTMVTLERDVRRTGYQIPLRIT